MVQSTIQEMFQTAVGHHRAGRFAVAEGLYREIIARDVGFAEAWHHLGLLALQAGQFQAAGELIGKAAGLSPGAAGIQSNWGEALRRQGKLEEAVAAYRRAIALRPDLPEAHANLGNALRDMGRKVEAEAAFRKAIALRGNFAIAHRKLGELLKERGEREEAIGAFRKVIALVPDFPGVHNELGNLLSDAGQLEEAIAEYERAVGQRPEDGVARLNLGNALREQKRYVEAAAMLRRAVELRPADPLAHQALGEALVLLYDVEGAETSFRRCVELAPESALLWNALGEALKFLGKFEEAGECFRRAGKTAVDVKSLKGLLSTGRGIGGAAEIAQLQSLLQGDALSVDDRIAAEFALGKTLDERERFDEAFEHYARGNRLFKESRAAAGERYDGDAVRRRVDSLIVEAAELARMTGGAGADDSELPVFIVGMPRSGTSLVEQIAASHRDVFGAGELENISQLSATIDGGPGGRNREAIARAARIYLGYLHSIGGKALRVTDKMPDNVFFLGLIAAMFPNARVIFCRRDPRDIGLSCFFERFEHNRLLYSYDLADFGRQYIETNRLIEHWRKTLPLRMLEIRYEALVANQEAESRRLIDFLGLPWDPACVEFHRTKRPVLTASLWQVRQPMYTRSVERWRNYEKYLGPLMEVLNSGH